MGWGFVGDALGAVGLNPGERFVQWAQLGPMTTPGDVLRAALAHNSTDYDAIGPLRTPVTKGGTTAYWAYRNEDGQWKLPTERAIVGDRGARDDSVSQGDIDMSRVLARATVSPPPGGTQDDGSVAPPAPPDDGGTTDAGPFGFVFGRTRPRIIQQRRCPPGMRLAKDGWCYPSSILPNAAKENISKKAVISWSDGNHIRKGRAAQKRLLTFAKQAGEDAKAIAPKTRRRTPAKKDSDALTTGLVMKLLGKGK